MKQTKCSLIILILSRPWQSHWNSVVPVGTSSRKLKYRRRPVCLEYFSMWSQTKEPPNLTKNMDQKELSDSFGWNFLAFLQWCRGCSETFRFAWSSKDKTLLLSFRPIETKNVGCMNEREPQTEKLFTEISSKDFNKIQQTCFNMTQQSLKDLMFAKFCQFQEPYLVCPKSSSTLARSSATSAETKQKNDL